MCSSRVALCQFGVKDWPSLDLPALCAPGPTFTDFSTLCPAIQISQARANLRWNAYRRLSPRRRNGADSLRTPDYYMPVRGTTSASDSQPVRSLRISTPNGKHRCLCCNMTLSLRVCIQVTDEELQVLPPAHMQGVNGAATASKLSKVLPRSCPLGPTPIPHGLCQRKGMVTKNRHTLHQSV